MDFTISKFGKIHILRFVSFPDFVWKTGELCVNLWIYGKLYCFGKEISSVDVQ